MKNYLGKTAYRGDIVKNYDVNRKHEDIWVLEDKWLENELKLLGSSKNVNSLLDIPVGTGRFFKIYKKHKSFNIKAADISSDMVLMSATVAEKNRLDVDLFEADATNIPIGNQSIDYVFCFRLFHLLPIDVINDVIEEFNRVAKKRIYIQVFLSSLKQHHEIKNIIVFKLPFFSRIICKYLAFKFNNKIATTKWAHIENFQYTVKELNDIFSKYNLNIARIVKLNSTTSPSLMYVLEKK